MWCHSAWLRFPGKKIVMEPDADVPKKVSKSKPFAPDGKLSISKDVLGPRWTPREGGAGPAYKRM